MPQVTCPKCGMTINLENRKKIDFNLIANATKKKPRTFTELLHITRLSRKTLSLRLKNLCADGTLVRDNGMYKLNGLSEFENRRFSRVLHDRRMRTGLMLIAFLLCSSASGYALAAFFTSKETHQKPVILGSFTMALNVSNVKDLYAWQAFITFDSNELEVMETTPGAFFAVAYPFFLNVTDIGEGRLLLGGLLWGNDPGKHGSGSLAIIVFGYFTDQYTPPRIVSNFESFETQLWDSKGSLISDSNSILELTIIENS